MSRQVIVNESVERPYAVAYSNEATAFAAYKTAVLENYCRYYGTEDDPGYDVLKKAKDVEGLGEWSEVMLLDEGDGPGVWACFSSADRFSLGGQLPLPLGEFIGNGDPNFHHTKGVPDGQLVYATPSVNGDETHPLYQDHLDAEDANEG